MLGMMARVMFMQQIWYPLEAVMSLSSILKKAGHDTSVSIGEGEKLLDEMDTYCPDIIAISTTTPSRQFMIATTKALRKHGYNGIIIAGGYDSSFFPRIIGHSSVDAICIGEGNDAIIELADAVERGKDYSIIKNLWVRAGGRITKNNLRPFSDLNKKPFNDWHIYRDYDPYFSDSIEFEQVSAGRGCPYGCSFCYNPAYRELYGAVDTKYCALRDPKLVIREIESIEDMFPTIRNIIFNDSTLGYNKKWLIEFCRLYKEHGINLSFTLNLCMNEVDDDICRALASTGKCFLIRLGLETGDEGFRTTVLNKPLCTDSACTRAAQLMRSYGLTYSLQVMLGLPGERLEGACHTLEMAGGLATGKNSVLINIFRPFQKLNLTDYGVKIGAYDKGMINKNQLIGSNIMKVFSDFRRDEESRRINNLAHLSHVYIRFPFIRGIIKRVLVRMPDNPLYRFIHRYMDYYVSVRRHINASGLYLLKYSLLHRKKAKSIR